MSVLLTRRNRTYAETLWKNFSGKLMLNTHTHTQSVWKEQGWDFHLSVVTAALTVHITSAYQ